MFLMAESANLLMAYLALEFVSLTSYILTGFLRHNRRSQEAALKYLIYGGVASGTMVYGMSWIFGIAGSMDFVAINKALTSRAVMLPRSTVYIALVLILAGHGLQGRLGAVSHVGARRLYRRADSGHDLPRDRIEGGRFRVAGALLLPRDFASGRGRQLAGADGVDWPQLLLVVCVITMSLGNLAALQQTNMKRLLAYS